MNYSLSEHEYHEAKAEAQTTERERVLALLNAMARCDYARLHPDYKAALDELRWKVADGTYT